MQCGAAQGFAYLARVTGSSHALAQEIKNASSNLRIELPQIFVSAADSTRQAEFSLYIIKAVCAGLSGAHGRVTALGKVQVFQAVQVSEYGFTCVKRFGAARALCKPLQPGLDFWGEANSKHGSDSGLGVRMSVTG